MQTVMYGPYRIALLPGAGGVVQYQDSTPPADRGKPHPPLVAVSTPLGREALVDAAAQTLATGRRVGFHGPCGIGKSTLLRHVALVAGRELGRLGIYLAVAPDEEPSELTQRLAQQIERPAAHARLTRGECARIFTTTRPVVALDIDSWPADRLEAALNLLIDCYVVLGSEGPCLGPDDSSWQLPGLADEYATTLLERDLGRLLARHEIAAAQRLVVAVRGHPLRLRQAAALIRTGAHRWENLAAAVEQDPAALTRLCHVGLSRVDRRVFGTLAALGGAFLSADLVDVIGDVGNVQQTLEKLYGRRLAEVDGDRFGLPACRLGGDRDRHLQALEVGSATKHIVTWLGQQDPTAADTLDMATAAVKLIKIAAERRQWREVVALLEVAEPILTLAGRWETCERLLDLGISAARQIGDLRAEALFHHEQGTLKLCEGNAEEARQHLTEALQQRRRIGNQRATDMTQHNLRMLAPFPSAPPPNPPGPRPLPTGSRRRLPTTSNALAAMIVLIVGLAGLVLGGGRVVSWPHAGSAQIPSTPAPGQSTSPTRPISDPSVGTPETAGQGTSPTTPPDPPLTLTPTSLTFPDREIGPPAPIPSRARPVQKMTLTNNATRSIVIDDIASDDEAFRIDATECATVAAGASCAVTVAFVPPEIGDFSGTVTVSPKGLAKLRAKVSGTGFATLAIEFGSSSAESVTDNTGTVACTATCKVTLTRPDQRKVELTADVCEGCTPIWSGCDATPPLKCRLTMTGNRSIKVDARDLTTPID